MTENEMPLKRQGRTSVIVTSSVIGLAAGVILCAISIFVMMPSMMIVTEECSLDFDETVSALEKKTLLKTAGLCRLLLT